VTCVHPLLNICFSESSSLKVNERRHLTLRAGLLQ